MMKVWKNNRGNASLYALVMVLCLLLLFTVISEYLRLQIIASGVRDALQSSVISVATENYDDVYNGLREGYSGAYQRSNIDKWEEQVDTGAVLMKMSDRLGLINGNKYASGHLEYRLENLRIDIKNAPFAKSDHNQRFEAEARVRVVVPLSFGWSHLEPMTIDIKVKAGYSPKF